MATLELTDPHMNVIFGDGLCATAVAKKHPKAQIVIPERSADSPTALHTNWRQPAIIYARQPGGLSNFYHGVMPGRLVTDSEWEETRAAFRLRMETMPARISPCLFSFVPFFPIRPAIAGASIMQQEAITVTDECRYFFCLSVVGNLQGLMRLGLIDEGREVGDHIVVKIGTVDLEELTKLLDTPRTISRLTGTYFRHLDLADVPVRLFFRPDLPGWKAVNFADSVHGFRYLLKRSNFVSLMLSGLYNKLGRPAFSKRFAIFAQIAIDRLYSVTSENVREVPDAQDIASELIEKTINACSTIFSTFRFRPIEMHDIFPGIHLYYDRRLLASLPKNITVLDTSLCENHLEHPTVLSAFRAYRES